MELYMDYLYSFGMGPSISRFKTLQQIKPFFRTVKTQYDTRLANSLTYEGQREVNSGKTNETPDQRFNEKEISQLRSPNDLQQAILKETNQEIYDFILSHLNLEKNFKSIVFHTENETFADHVDFNNLRAVVNVKKVNSIPDLNSYYRAVNKLLPDAGIYIGKVDTYLSRTNRTMAKYGKILGNIICAANFIFNRAIPKIRPLDRVYRFVTQNKVHLYSRAEVLGRLVYCGFEIIEYKIVDGYTYFVGMKTQAPMVAGKKPSYYPLFKMQRVGKNGKMIGVYKLRTMHPYSEFLQDFVVRMNGYNDVGKPANDFRVTSWGKYARKLWLDEMPQIINVLKGEMKLVGVRPLSKVRFSELPEEVQKARVKHKPGCFPPYVALCMPDSEKNIEAEVIYMKEKEKNPYTTDMKYLLKSVFNIVTNKIRSA
jgi:lipopolysaccharide/colanic/teichoic acid biosynthesis glycosyltransferase